jgi:small subunit ribosomal protein S1
MSEQLNPTQEALQPTPPAASETAQIDDDALENMDEMSPEELEALYEQTMTSFKEGEVVRGTVVEITDDFVVVDIGYKSEGAIPIHEFNDPAMLNVGEEFDVYIDVPENEDGVPILSKVKADKIKNWTQIQKVYEDDGVIKGRIVRRVKGGLKVDIGIDAFMPASQLTWRPTSDLDKFLGEEMELKIIKLTKRRRNVVVSRRKLLEEQRAGEKEKLLKTIEIGQVIPGEVKNITDFGAFVDVGGIDGLLHVTDMSWGRVKHPSQVVNVGDKIEVMVLNFDKESERISLGLKQKSDNPWQSAEERYPIGSVTHGRVVSMTDYGAFIQLEDGIEGMVHVSEMSWTRRVRHPSEVLQLDEIADVMVLNVDPESEKIALGIKQTRPNPWRDIEQRYPVNSTVKGVVRNMTDYGAFVAIEEGIDALLHVSDISWTRKVGHPSEVLEKGQEVDVKILSIDPDNEKISVGLKQLEDDPWQAVVANTPIGKHVEVEVAKLVSFGAFARLTNGVEGLIHVSELADERIQKPEDVLNVGDKVMAKVISIDPVERKIGLSIKEHKHDMDTETHSAYASSGSGSVSIGDVVGGALPQSLLQGAGDPTSAANEMLAELSDQDKSAPEAPAETEEASGSEEEKTE